jgi:hypothetical protein
MQRFRAISLRLFDKFPKQKVLWNDIQEKRLITTKSSKIPQSLWVQHAAASGEDLVERVSFEGLSSISEFKEAIKSVFGIPSPLPHYHLQTRWSD